MGRVEIHEVKNSNNDIEFIEIHEVLLGACMKSFSREGAWG